MSSIIRNRFFRTSANLIPEIRCNSCKEDIIESSKDAFIYMKVFYKNTMANPKKIVLLNNSHFINGSVIIAPDYYLITDPSSGISQKIIGDTTGYIFRLTEDIVFDPNLPVITGNLNDDIDSVWNSSSVLPSQFIGYSGSGGPGAFYDPAAFGIGFFAALVVSARNVIIDLNRHSISQGPTHFLHQRFYANIELADRPFIPNQGPHNFGSSITSALRVCVVNGHIGRSSHHGIHSNNNRYL